MKQVILCIDAALGDLGQNGPGHKGIQAVAEQQKTGLTGVR